MKSKIGSLFLCLVMVTSISAPITQDVEEPGLSSSGSGGGGLADSPWPMFRGNLNHTGLSPYDTSANTGKLKWNFTTNGHVRSSPAMGSDGTIYVGSRDFKIYAFDPDGKQKWTFITGGHVDSSPAIGSDGTIYVGSKDNNLYAINSNGTKKWSFKTDWEVNSSPAIGLDGTIYIGSYDHNLYAINPNGTEKWRFTTGGNLRTSPAIGFDGTIYIGSYDFKLYAINPDGTEKWNFTTGDKVSTSSPAIGPDGIIYVGSNDHKLYAIYPNGTEKWNFVTYDDVDSSPAIGSDGTIYVGSNDRHLYAINPDGTEKWNFPIVEKRLWYSSPAIGSDGTIYVGYDTNKLYAINPDGTEKWSYITGDGIRSSPAIGSDGTIYIGCSDGKLYAIGSTTPEITVEKTANVTVAKPGDSIEYTIYYNNTGPDEAGTVWINDTLPEGVTFVTSSAEANRTGDYNWTFHNVGPGEYSFMIEVKINEDIPNGTILTNSVHLDYLDFMGNPMPESLDSVDIIVIADEHEPPIADAGHDQTVNEGETAKFDGTGSYASEGTIYRYEWDFDSDVDSDGDGYTSNDVDATGPNPIHVYGDNGVYTVTLNVTSRWETGEMRKDYQDCVFVMDSSGSMVTTDPKNLRIEAAKHYVDKMIPDDRACVVEFDTDATLVNGHHLSMDYAQIINDLGTIDASGGTYISTGLDTSIDELLNFGDPDHTQVIILITDAQNNDPADIILCLDLANISASKGIIIFTIGLNMISDSSPEQLLEAIANITGGKYFPAPNAEYLEAIYEEISTIVENYSAGEISDRDTMLVTVENVLPTLDPIGSQVKAVTEKWVARYDGLDNQEDVARDLAIDSHQNVYVIGSSYSNETYNDYVTIAYDISGHERWIAKYNGPENGYDEGQVIVLDKIGNVYISGTSYSNESNEGETNYDIVTIKYDSFGNELWVARFNGPGNSTDSVKAMAVDSFGNLIVTGCTYSDESYYDIVIIKYDNLGNDLWCEIYNSPYNNHDRVNALTLDPLDIIYVTGYSYGNGTDKDYITIKYDTNGTRLWNIRYNGLINYEDSASDIVVDLETF